jgi:glyoxylase-like metal-dependent hydrolase (beta-lactamase superfamily II)
VLRRNGAAQLAETIEGFANAGAGPGDDRSDWEHPDDWLTPGTLPLAGGRVLDVVHTPGHTTGHVVFHDSDGALLFAGDHVLPTITPSIGFEPIETKDPLGAVLRSLSVVRSRPDALLLPAHGPVAPSAHARVDELIAHHGTRLDQVLAAMSSGATTAAEIAGIQTWTRRERKLADLDPFNSMLAISETGAHLELLVAQGRATVTEDGGVLRYA